MLIFKSYFYFGLLLEKVYVPDCQKKHIRFIILSSDAALYSRSV